jgi:hypothetical protein
MKTASASRWIGVGMAVLGLLIGITGRAEAGLIIGNYPPTNDGGDIGIFPGNVVAAGFRMPTDMVFRLDSFTMRVLAMETDTTAKVELFGDRGGIPSGPALDTFTAPVIPGDQYGDVTVTPRSPIALRPTAAYWIAVTDLTGSFNWATSSPPVTPTGLATSDGYLIGGPVPPFPPTTPVGSDFAPTFRVEGTLLGGSPVPEPSSQLLFAIGVTASAIGARRRIGRMFPTRQ